MQKKQLPFFYGWIMVAAGAVILGLTHGIVANCFSIFLLPVTEDLGFSRQGFSVCHMLVNLVYMAISLFSGPIYRHISIKKSMRICAVILPIAYACFGLCSTLPMFCVCSVVIGITYPLLAFLPLTQVLNNWFEEKRGTAIGFCFMGSSLGGMIINAVSNAVISAWGWRQAYFVVAAIMLIGLFPCVYFVLKVTPEEKGLTAYGLGKGKTVERPIYGPAFKAAVRTPRFFLAVLIVLIIGAGSTVLSQLIIPQLNDLGFETHASRAMSAYLGILTIFKVLLGQMSDRFGEKKATVISTSAMAVGLAGLLLGRYPAAHAAIVLGAALGCAAGTVCYPLITRYGFGTRDYVAIYGVLNAASSLAASFSLLLANSMYAATGSYTLAVFVFLGLIVAAVIMILVLPQEKIPAREQTPAADFSVR